LTKKFIVISTNDCQRNCVGVELWACCLRAFLKFLLCACWDKPRALLCSMMKLKFNLAWIEQITPTKNAKNVIILWCIYLLTSLFIRKYKYWFSVAWLLFSIEIPKLRSLLFKNLVPCARQWSGLMREKLRFLSLFFERVKEKKNI
jgi:hypothetical protein